MRKTIMGLCAFAGLTGCVTRQPIIYRETTKTVHPDGTQTETTSTNAGNTEQFTWLGNVWNMGTYGALGTVFGLYTYPKEGFCNPETKSTAQKIWDGSVGIVTGPFRGCLDGMHYGYNLDYNQGRSVEGIIFDTIEHGANKTGQFIHNLGR